MHRMHRSHHHVNDVALWQTTLINCFGTVRSPCSVDTTTPHWVSQGEVGWDSGCGKKMGRCHNTAALLHLCRLCKTPCGHPLPRRPPPPPPPPHPWPPTGYPPSPEGHRWRRFSLRCKQKLQNYLFKCTNLILLVLITSFLECEGYHINILGIVGPKGCVITAFLC